MARSEAKPSETTESTLIPSELWMLASKRGLVLGRCDLGVEAFLAYLNEESAASDAAEINRKSTSRLECWPIRVK